MEATISETFNGTRIVCDASDPEFTRFHSLSDIRKCNNVLIEPQKKGRPFVSAIIGDEYVELIKSTFKHPYGGKETVYEVI